MQHAALLTEEPYVTADWQIHMADHGKLDWLSRILMTHTSQHTGWCCHLC